MSWRLTAPAEYAEEIRKSRFLARAVPLDDPGRAAALLTELGDPAASHNCWAWKLGAQYRFSDDGEPGGTAGRPILAAIEQQEFDAVLVVVTRWYGGIQLGTGGLARAYGGCARQCLQQAPRQAHVPRLSGECHLGFAELAALKPRLAGLEVLLEDEQYDAQGARLRLAVPPQAWAATAQLVSDLSRGRAQLTPRT